MGQTRDGEIYDAISKIGTDIQIMLPPTGTAALAIINSSPLMACFIVVAYVHVC